MAVSLLSVGEQFIKPFRQVQSTTNFRNFAGCNHSAFPTISKRLLDKVAGTLRLPCRYSCHSNRSVTDCRVSSLWIAGQSGSAGSATRAGGGVAINRWRSSASPKPSGSGQPKPAAAARWR